MKNFTSFRPLYRVAYNTLTAALVFSLQACDSKIEDVSPQIEDRTALSSDAIRQAEFIEGHYIVVLKDDETRQNRNMPESFEERRGKARAYGHTILNEKAIPTQALYSAYGFALSGFAAKLTPAQASALQADSRVAYIERDQVVRLIEPLARVSTTSTSSTTGEIKPLGITRVGGGTENYEAYSTTTTGDGTETSVYTGNRAYIIDTGILQIHPDLNVETDRLRRYNAFCDDISGDGPDYVVTTCMDPDRATNDGNGHGTHVAGTIGARVNDAGVVGVAPGIRVVPVKVLGNSGSGTLSNVLEGVDFVHYEAEKFKGEGLKVANMSLGASASTALDDAVTKVANAGVLFAIAAGNDAMLARNYSPARVNHMNVFTIAAMSTKLSSKGWADAWASFSNYGQPPVDFIAPGVDVYSTYVVKNSDGTLGPTYASLSGTSMAAPHVAGLLLLNGTSINRDGIVKRTARDVYNVAHR